MNVCVNTDEIFSTNVQIRYCFQYPLLSGAASHKEVLISGLPVAAFPVYFIFAYSFHLCIGLLSLIVRPVIGKPV